MNYSRIEEVSKEVEYPASLLKQWRALRKARASGKLTKLLKNPLTLVLATWLVMAVLLWLEITHGQ